MTDLTTSSMARSGLEELKEMDKFITVFRQPPYRYEWGTIKNKVVLIGKFGDCLYTKQTFSCDAEWYNRFKIAYKNCISTCSYHMREHAALKAREVGKYKILNYLIYKNDKVMIKSCSHMNSV